MNPATCEIDRANTRRCPQPTVVVSGHEVGQSPVGGFGGLAMRMPQLTFRAMMLGERQLPGGFDFRPHCDSHKPSTVEAL